MKIIKDNFTIPEFTFTTTCSSCGSVLEISEVNDFFVKDMYEEKEVAFKCCLCGYENILSAYSISQIPPQVIRAVQRIKNE